jgi:hypothetical protein
VALRLRGVSNEIAVAVDTVNVGAPTCAGAGVGTLHAVAKRTTTTKRTGEDTNIVVRFQSLNHSDLVVIAWRGTEQTVSRWGRAQDFDHQQIRRPGDPS